MLLTENQVQEIMEKAKTAFPRFSDWDCMNEPDSEYTGFTLWGKFILDLDQRGSQIFFVTFSIFRESWRGELTTGQHAYRWSSTEDGDAHLLGSKYCESFEIAVAELKNKILTLFQAFSIF
ncbi:MAG: hypothetical protein H7Y37_06810 [Anaerolineae bacterium]|nr:hypothetical protein [Gloeobacterales cyanobacterium ES-bin-313]